MTGLALILVLVAACAHATWNFLAKKASGGKAFLWLFACISSLFYLPLAVWILLVNKPYIGAYQVLFILISTALQAAYFITLDKGYRIGDLSVIYPLARGTGPMLSIIAAILIFREHPTVQALIGAALIGLGVVIIAGNPMKLTSPESRKPFLFALLCGSIIACYTISDKAAVSTFLVPPLLLNWTSDFGRLLLLTPYARTNWDKVHEQWTLHKKEAIAVAILCPLAYILVLTAMIANPVSYIAPTREISVLIGSVLGAKLLSEENIKIRLIGASAMVIGMFALALG